MAGEVIATIVGNLGDNPELRFTPNGAAVCRARVAVTPRKRDGDKYVDGEVTWYSVTLWRNLGENFAHSMAKGDKVIVHGAVENRAWEGKDGETRYSLELNAYSAGPALDWVTAQLGDGVHEGAKARKKSTTSQKDPFAEASAERPAAGAQSAKPATAGQQRAAQASDEEPPW